MEGASSWIWEDGLAQQHFFSTFADLLMALRSGVIGDSEGAVESMFRDDELVFYTEVALVRSGLKARKDVVSKITLADGKELDYNEVGKKIRQNNFKAVKENDEAFLMKVDKMGSERQVVSIGNIEEKLREVHDRQGGHGGQRNTFTRLKEQYYGIPERVVRAFCKNCEQCQRIHAQKKGRKQKAHSSIRSDAPWERVQADVRDLRSAADVYPYRLDIKDHFTKFHVMYALSTKGSDEVADKLLEAFCMFGFPVVLHSDNGMEFAGEVITKLKRKDPSIQLIKGRPRWANQQGLVEQMHDTVDRKCQAIMAKNKTKRWSTVLAECMHMLNTSKPSEFPTTPMDMMMNRPGNK